jgi:acyl-CoA synthetase (AMP-forming)/AMP-acid ligase II
VAFVSELAVHGDATALITSAGVLSYRELAARVTETAERLAGERRLILLAGANTVESLVAYLGAMAAGHAVLLVAPDRAGPGQPLVTTYDPDIVVSPGGVIDERRTVSAHAMHPDLALLLSTSGSTGSPKLVRLSHENLQANAESIAEYLDIRGSDRAATTLPIHYCYGLSVIHSHLSRGAALIVTERSIADPGFWELFRAARGTTFAGVPYTFDLLDRVGFDAMRLPHLRYITQAGGRLPPDQVVRYAEMGRQRGWDLVVMYGQTEATARMAYLPPHLTARHPQAIGVPIPGGSLRLEPVPDCPDPDTGELIYSGPNVMLGYADGPSDLDRGRTVHELHTGDIARRTPAGLYEVVGRRGGFVKIFGLRIDVRRVEEMLAGHGLAAGCTGADDVLIVAVAGDADARRARKLVAAQCGLPSRAVHVRIVTELPRLATGKLDYQAIRELARSTPKQKTDRPEPPETDADLCRLYAQVLDRTDVTPGSSFVSLGGDSLSYVEMSVKLEAALGHLPPDWHTLPIRDLNRPVRRPKRWNSRRTLETGVALRAVAIVLIVGSHLPIFMIKGGAHVLLAVAGFNFARFHLTSANRRERRRNVLNTAVRIAVPSIAWITLAALSTDGYHLRDVLLVNGILGHRSNYWFIEIMVYTLITMAACLTIPALDTMERRFPFEFPLLLCALGLVTRYDLFGITTQLHLTNAIVAFWLFPLGWAAARANTAKQRMLITAIVLITVPGYFGPEGMSREILIVAGVMLLIWVRRLPSLSPLNHVAGLLAAGTLYIYLTHWQIYPLFRGYPQLLALFVSIAIGIAYTAVATKAMRYLKLG